MKIIIEGLDRCGKSTLIDNLTKHYKLPFIKLHFYGPPFKNVDQNIAFDVSLYTDMVKAFMNFDHVIADRSHLGALVYSPLYRNNNGYHVLDLDKQLPSDVILITLIDNKENLINRDDGESFTIDLDKKQKEIDLFINAHILSNIKHKLLINISKYNIEEVLQKTVNYINSIGETN